MTKIKKTPVKMFVVIAAFLFACGSGSQPPTLKIIQVEHTSTVTTADTVSERSEANDDETANVVTKTVHEGSDKSVEEKIFFSLVEVPPVFDKEEERINIEREFYGYMEKNVVFPKDAMEIKDPWRDGRVWAEFFIDTDGSMIDVNLVRGKDPALNDEVLRVLKNGPKWKSHGKEDGKPVKVYFSLMYHFILKD